MNKIILDGKEYELSAELVEKIKAEVAEQEIERMIADGPFARMRSDSYHFISAEGSVCTGCETGTIADDERYSVASIRKTASFVSPITTRTVLMALFISRTRPPRKPPSKK